LQTTIMSLGIPAGVTGAEMLHLLSKQALTAHLKSVGAKGGSATSTAKSQAAAANGKKGGRPINPDSKRQRSSRK
jgi:hypothetical protein